MNLCNMILTFFFFKEKNEVKFVVVKTIWSIVPRLVKKKKYRSAYVLNIYTHISHFSF